MRILKAAISEFSSKGFGGARIDAIANRAKTNKRMIYHYFGNKEDLFLAVLEDTYESIRSSEEELHLKEMEPVEGMRRLVSFSFHFFVENPEFISLLNSENLHKARHVKRSSKIREINYPLIEIIGDLLHRGCEQGVFRPGVDPVQLYITIAGTCYFYFSNVHTLSVIFDRDLMDKRLLEEREAHVIAVILGYLRP